MFHALLIVTNWHVVEDAPQVAVIFKPLGITADIENAKVMSANVLYTNKEKDLALLQLLGSFSDDLPNIELGSIDKIEIGADTHAIGHPSGLNWTYTKDFVSSYLNVGREHWFHCTTHKLKWNVGSNLFSSWRSQSDDEWRALYAPAAATGLPPLRLRRISAVPNRYLWCVRAPNFPAVCIGLHEVAGLFTTDKSNEGRQ